MRLIRMLLSAISAESLGDTPALFSSSWSVDRKPSSRRVSLLDIARYISWPDWTLAGSGKAASYTQFCHSVPSGSRGRADLRTRRIERPPPTPACVDRLSMMAICCCRYVLIFSHHMHLSAIQNLRSRDQPVALLDQGL